jgi:hypothetical protein
MLRASAVPLGAGEFITPIDPNYLGGQRSLGVKRLIRQQDVEAALPPGKRPLGKEKAVGFGGLAIFVFFVICAFTGFGDVINWLFRK